MPMSHPLLEQLGERILSVAEYLDLVNELITPLRVSVEGEVSDLKVLSQWTFFALKDAESGALLPCGLHSGQYRKIGVNLDEGMRVKVEGYGKINHKSGRFGFWVSHIEPVGEGALRRAYELLVKKLADEGLFTRKRELPPFISHIGVISSRNGVVLQDLRNNLAKRGVRIDFLHSGVEGAGSAEELFNAITRFLHAKDRPQVLVLIRGGGSLESLQGFNNEAVCRALFAAPMPVLVGIGHDVDAPIATLVADWSASTPTAVAHVINASWAPLTERMPLLAERTGRAFGVRLRTVAREVPLMARTVRERYLRGMQVLFHRIARAEQGTHHAIRRVLERFAAYEQAVRYALRRIPQQLRELGGAGERSTARIADAYRTRMRAISGALVLHERLLAARDPERILARGYGLLYDTGGKLVRSVAQVAVGSVLRARMSDGTIEATVTATGKP